MDESRLRIAILFPSNRNATWDTTRELALRLKGAGHAVTLINPARTMRDVGHGMREERAPFPAWERFRIGVTSAISLVRAVRGFDLVYVTSPGIGIGPWPLISPTSLWAKLTGVGPTQRTWDRLQERIVLRTAHTVVLESEAAGEVLRARNDRLPTTCVIPPVIEIPSCADPEPLVDYELVPNCYYLAVCEPEPEYHVREIVEGFLAARAAFPLVIAGDFERGTSYARELRLLAGARVRFVGEVNEQEKLHLLRCHARACFHGQAWGGCGDLLEVLGSGTPIITFDSAENRELAGGFARYVSTASDVPAVVAWAEDLDGAERHSRANAARKRVITMHGWARVTSLYLDALKKFSRNMH